MLVYSIPTPPSLSKIQIRNSVLSFFLEYWTAADFGELAISEPEITFRSLSSFDMIVYENTLCFVKSLHSLDRTLPDHGIVTVQFDDDRIILTAGAAQTDIQMILTEIRTRLLLVQKSGVSGDPVQYGLT